jgi:two-component system chemotaxis response regulator CheY
MRLLVVDDNPKNAKLLEAILTPYGECESVESGKAAILAFEKAWNDWRPFSFIFLDIMMPEMDGEQVLANIRETEQNKNINDLHRAKIIMVSAHSDEASFNRCIQSGCDDFIVKPFNKEIIIKKLIKHGANGNLTKQI